MQTTDRTHDQAAIELLRQDPAFAADYIAAALEDADQPGGQVALLAALRQVAGRKAWRRWPNVPAWRERASTGRCLPRATRHLKRSTQHCAGWGCG